MAENWFDHRTSARYALKPLHRALQKPRLAELCSPKRHQLGNAAISHRTPWTTADLLPPGAMWGDAVGLALPNARTCPDRGQAVAMVGGQEGLAQYPDLRHA
eukprot:7327505-Pyramimonas_sp.AAC.1